ncbi:MAG TPA: hypothetical protein VNE82_14570 [Candidatus Binataceae bacterium]|nr:hypothetical protein [Candidatus Binataceae bacterium]
MVELQGRERRLHDRHVIVPDASRSSRAFARLALAAMVLGWAVLGARAALAQDDDWSVVSDQVQSPQVQSPQAHRSHPSPAEPAGPVAPQVSQPAAADGARMICGELARPATEPYKSIVADINREWGTNAPVYESVRADSPHVSRAGCIFYNPVFMAVFLRGETDEHGQPDKTSMTYAIMAHELGHIVHHDYRRTGVSSVTKELEADRFSGYTLERLGIARDNITPFYSMGGDEFSGVHNHGFSNQRIAAFNNGWQRAEWNQPEGGDKATQGIAGSTASDDPGEADDSSAAAAVP